jgi:imidazole glycerol-phosphate synthase subunit HisH
MKVSIIKYHSGNILSVYNALKRLGVEASITGNHDEIMSADKVIFPGVGEASSTMKYLKEHRLDSLIKNLKQPVLGICLGLQLMCRHTEEGDTDCLGIFNIYVKRFKTDALHANLKVPHMGWNSIKDLKGKLFDKTLEGQYVYFVHSYYAEKGEETIATANYGIDFSSALEKNNFFAMQFHPEKSGKTGEQILRNFLDIKL